jgi:hypothetical protein
MSLEVTVPTPTFLSPNITSSSHMIPLDPEFKPYIEFLQQIDQQFFPSQTKDAPTRLWQRYMLLPYENLQTQIFSQHEEFIQQSIFQQDDHLFN